MKQITQYQCEKCHGTWNTEADAVRCENYHARDVSIKSVKYTEGSLIPESITLSMCLVEGDSVKSDVKYVEA